MRLYVNLPVPLARVLVVAAERAHRRPSDELMALAEAELRRRGLIDLPDLVGMADGGGDVRR